MEANRSARSSRIREHFRSNVVGYIAIFLFAVAGTASALPGKNTVDSGDIKNKQVKRADIAPRAVNGSRVADGAISGADVNEASLAPVPSAADAAAIGGAAAAEIVRTDPGLPERTRPFLTGGTLDITAASTDSLDIGFLTLGATLAGGSIRICNQAATAVDFNYVQEYTPGAAHNSLAPGGCINYAAVEDVIQIAAETINSTDAVYATLIDPMQDDHLHAWILGGP